MRRDFSDAPVRLIRILPAECKPPHPLKPTGLQWFNERISAMARRWAAVLEEIGILKRAVRAQVTSLSQFGAKLASLADRLWVKACSSGRVVADEMCVAKQEGGRRMKTGLAWLQHTGRKWMRASWKRTRRTMIRAKIRLVRWSEEYRHLRAEAHVRAPQVVERKPDVLDEVRALRSQMAMQQQEMSRLMSHVAELQAQMLSQQQVLMYLGKEIETLHVPVLGLKEVPVKTKRRPAAKKNERKQISPPKAQVTPEASL
jgi:HAMP domain-containing protein